LYRFTKRTQFPAFSTQKQGLPKKRTQFEPKVGGLSLPKGEASPLHYHLPRPEGTPLILAPSKIQNKPKLNIFLIFIEAENYETKPNLF
jgi:hypothetical protein